MKHCLFADNYFFFKYKNSILIVIAFTAAVTTTVSYAMQNIISSLKMEDRLRYIGYMMIVTDFLLLYLVLYIIARLNKFLLQYQVVNSPKKRYVFNALFLCALIWGLAIYLMSTLLCLLIILFFMHEFFDSNAIMRLIGFIAVQATGFIRLILIGLVVYIMYRKVIVATVLPFFISAILFCGAILVYSILPLQYQPYEIKILVCTISCSLTYSEIISEYLNPYIYAAVFMIEIAIIYGTGLKIFENRSVAN